MSERQLILVVDDEGDIREYMTFLLEDNGYEVMAACDGAQALKMLEERRPALVTLDINMPEKTGVNLLGELRQSEKFKDLPIIVVTGVGDEFRKFITQQKDWTPPDGYISKPLDQEDLLATIKRLIKS